MAVSNHLGLYLPTREDYISVKRDLSDNFELIDASAEMVEKGVAIPVDGDTAPIALTAGEYILLKNHSSLASGGYVVQSNIAAQASITSGNVSPLGKGLTNALNNNLANKQKKFEWTDYDASAWQKAAYDALQALSAEECKTATLATNNGYHFIAMLQKSDPIRSALFSDANGNIILLYSNTSGASYVVKTIGLLN